MIDSKKAQSVFDVIEEFREYVIQTYGSSSFTARDYLSVVNRLTVFASTSPDTCSVSDILERFYTNSVGVPAFDPPKMESKKIYARAILILRDISRGESPKRKYANNSFACPESYQMLLEKYEQLMVEKKMSQGTIRTRSGRMKIFFIYLANNGCYRIEDITPELLVRFISSLKEKYSSQGSASILYTIRNYFSFIENSEMIQFDPLPLLTGIHSRKHERLASFYSADEIRRVMESVDRTTPWGKTIYLMMLLACVYGLRSSDIKALRLDNIIWKQRIIRISQFKTHREVTLPITEEVLYALLDYMKNARPQTDWPNVFIRLRKPYIPYSMNDHFGNKLVPFFRKAGVNTEGKHCGLHSLRHSLATNLSNNGIPVNEIATILGHSSAESTKTYVWSDIEHLRIAALEVPYA